MGLIARVAFEVQPLGVDKYFKTSNMYRFTRTIYKYIYIYMYIFIQVFVHHLFVYVYIYMHIHRQA